MPNELERLSQEDLKIRLQNDCPIKGIVTFDNKKTATIEINPISTCEIPRGDVDSAFISFSESMPEWVPNPALLNEKKIYTILYQDITNSASSLGTALSLTEVSGIKSTVRFQKQGKFSPKMYWQGWGGGSRAKIKVYKVTSLAKKGGNSIFWLSIPIDLVAVSKGVISPKKFITNTAVGAISLIAGGWVGLAIGLVYWALDSKGVFDEPNFSGVSKRTDIFTQPVDNLRVVIPEMAIPQQVIKRKYSPKQAFFNPALKKY